MTRAALLLLAVLLVAAPAHASSVGGGPEMIAVQATAVEVNDIVLRQAEDGRLEVTDSAVVETWSWCEAIDPHTVRCPMPTERISVALASAGGETDTAANTVRIGPGVTARVSAIGAEGPDAFYGGPGDDYFWTREGDDRLVGGGGADRLEADSGNDVLAGDGTPWVVPPPAEGEPRGDYLGGGPGDDELEGGPEYDVINGESGRDRVSYAGHPMGVRVRGDVMHGTIARPWTDLLVNVEVVIGSPFADVIQGSDAADEIHGEGGDDQIAGGGAADLVDGGDGDDRVFGDTVNPEAAGDEPVFPGHDDELRGGAGNDLLRGDAGRDLLTAGSGDDTVDAREETPTLEERDDLVACGDGFDRGRFDWNDAGSDCEEVVARDKPPMPRPSDEILSAPRPPGPGPQPALGSPVAAGGVVRVPVHCAAARRCTARLRVREVRSVRVGRRLRSRPGRILVGRTVSVPGGQTVVVVLPLPAAARARVRRAGSGLASVDLRLGSRRWTRPLGLTRDAVARR